MQQCGSAYLLYLEPSFVYAPGGSTRILVTTCVNKKRVKRSLLFAVECVKQGLQCHFSGKKGLVLSKFTQILQTQTYLWGQIWGKIQQNPCLRDDFCTMTKMCLGIYFKTVVHACVHLHSWVTPLHTYILVSCECLNYNELIFALFYFILNWFLHNYLFVKYSLQREDS